ncbi:MAG: endonuclease [Oleiphilaceae bacterium]|nr:endonuclease [Oleiphilaceae bacterium]
MERKHLLIALCLVILVLSLAEAAAVKDPPRDPEQALRERLWEEVYQQGGTTLYCREAFEGRHMLLTESPVYFLNQARQHLRCGTRRKCLREDETYRALVMDLHNVFPAQARFEHRRRGPHYSEIDQAVSRGECGERNDFGRFEPPPHARGTVARALFHMHSRYQLPLPGDLNTLRQWHRDHPPGEEEQRRNRTIEQLQGFDNPFISNPSLAEQLL